jgi:hypothetical protein
MGSGEGVTEGAGVVVIVIVSLLGELLQPTVKRIKRTENIRKEIASVCWDCRPLDVF